MSWFRTLDEAPRSRLAVPVAMVAALCFVVFNEVGFQRAVGNIDANEGMLDTRVQLRRLQLLMFNAETGQRGYLLTQQNEFREPYEKSRLQVDAQLSTLRAIYANQPQRIEQMTRVESLTRDKMAELKTTLELAEAGRRAAALDLVASGIGRETMKALDEQLSAMTEFEQRRTAANQQGLRDALRVNRLGIHLLVALSLFSMVLFVRQTRRLDREREVRRGELQAERNKLEDEVAKRTQELTELARHLQTVREDERSHLARELHDELGGLLTTAKLDVARVKSRLLKESGVATAEIAERMSHLVATLDAGISLKRRIIEDLRPSTLSNLGLRTALQVLCTEFAERSEIKVNTQLQDLPLPEALQLTVYRLVQESLTNVAKYARAKQIDVHLRAHEGGARVTVTDDGVGFDPQRVPVAAHGLAGMRFRVASAGGNLQVESQPGSGTRIVAQLPLASPQAA